MNKYRHFNRLFPGLHWLVAAMAAALVVACGGGGGGGEDEDPTTPTITAASVTRAVVRKGDATPLPTAFAVTVTNPGTGTVAWRDEGGTSRGSGDSLLLAPLASTASTGLTVGERTLTATITNPRNGRSAQTTFSLLVLADTANTDDDNDGLSYDEEKAANTQPGNADSDNDGLADGAEAGLGTNPALADSNSNGTNDGVELAGPGGASLPPRSLLAAEAGLSAGVTIGSDSLSVSFGSQLNQDCVNRVAPVFTAPVYNPATFPFGLNERCAKRAVRANVGVAQGEFRYFETRRFTGFSESELQNIGQGIITPSAQIDPYCCYVDPSEADFPYNDTPPSMTINAVGGVFSRLQLVNPAGFTTPLVLANTQFYGFAIDYTGASPVVYVVGRNAGGEMTVSNQVDPGSFGDAAAMPMMHGHPVTGTGPHAAMNLGATKFHYSLDDVRTALTNKGVTNAASLAGGVGIHRW